MQTQEAPKTIEQRWSSTTNKVSTSGPTTAEQVTNTIFLDSKTRGIIKFIPASTDSGIQPIEILAEDVQIEKQVALNTQTTLGKSQVSTSTSEDGTETQSQEMSQITIQFTTTFTPTGYTKRSEYIEARSNFLFNYENNIFLAISDMFRKATPMQVRSIQYTIPAGEDSAIYTIQIVQVEEAIDDRTAQSSQPEDKRANQDGSSYLPNTKASYLNSTTNSTST